MYEYFTSATKPNYAYVWPADLIFITFTFIELILKVGNVQ